SAERRSCPSCRRDFPTARFGPLHHPRQTPIRSRATRQDENVSMSFCSSPSHGSADWRAWLLSERKRSANRTKMRPSMIALALTAGQRGSPAARQFPWPSTVCSRDRDRTRAQRVCSRGSDGESGGAVVHAVARMCSRQAVSRRFGLLDSQRLHNRQLCRVTVFSLVVFGGH